ncbi:MAG TPA: FAD-binding and (Fe-S)-binding domain-containing protein [Acidimicrobiales bacterium]|nr:FAD-binding and (Fe-S)-binding domain-containing protein [Acidimicrobiales bacterium]
MRAKLDEAKREALGRALGVAVRGEVRFDAVNRAAYASDSSNYRQVPLGVVFPQDEGDVRSTARLAAEAGAALLARGAGTSLAGQCCNEAVVLDMSRHMRRILQIDPEERVARVEPGVVLDDLRREAERHGLTFGPDPATHAWCTIGGMIGNNSCGTHGLYAGKTSDNVKALRVVLAGGEQLEVGSYGPAALDETLEGGGRLGSVLSALMGLQQRYGALVAERYPRIPRRVSGFNLDELSSERGTHVARALVGTESTCAFTTEATLHLVTSPPVRCLVVLGYRDIYAAAEAVPELLEHSLLALEGFDRSLVDQMNAHGLNQAGVALLPPGNGWLLAETGGASEGEARSKAQELKASLPAGVGARVLGESEEQRLLWAVRESGLGATAIRLDGHHNYEGWEDGAVPPERLAEYLRGIEELWKRHGYSGAWYGHFGQGCVHTRNNFDFASAEGLANYRRYVTAAAELVVTLGGSLSGEHGDGQSRAELLTAMFGPELVSAFSEFKRIWDPEGLMNPGKVVDPYPLDANIRYVTLKDKGRLKPSEFDFKEDAGSLLHASLRCVGVGRCRREDTATMCPSYRATRDEVHSTRGRARLLTEMFQGSPVQESWRNEEVREALELCLSCKACAVDCPTHVDMATYKSEFYFHYYRGRPRPLAMYAMGLVPWVSSVATSAPPVAWLANSALSGGQTGKALRAAAGLATNRAVPRFSAEGGLRKLARAATPHPGSERADRAPASTTVVVWPDTFTESFRPHAGTDLVGALEALGERVAVPTKWACCGRTLYDFGMLRLAKRTLRRLVSVLEPWVSAGIPVVVPEPSCLAAFRDELPSLLPGQLLAEKLASLARSPAEHIVAAGHLDRLSAHPGKPRPMKAVLHPHCHQRAVIGTNPDLQVLSALGYDARLLDAGCCGLAGSFGFNAKHEPVSRAIGRDWWLPRVKPALSPGADGQEVAFVVDGFSCQTQLLHLAPELVPRVTDLPSLLRRATYGHRRP